jgi:hemolysin III
VRRVVEEELVRPRLRGVVHAYAFWVAVVATAALVLLAAPGMPRFGATVYGVGLCALFAGSAIYHRWRWNPRWRPLLRRIDHSTIFVFIAATYTPVGLIEMSGWQRPTVLGCVWAGAVLGVLVSVFWIQAPRGLTAGLYVLLGWMALLAAPQLVSAMPATPLLLIVAGGVLYTAGAVIYALRRPDPWPTSFGFHEIFHTFVVLAAVAHFVAIGGWVVA